MLTENFISNDELQIKTSKTGYFIPVVRNVHLHSIYNPIKEADVFVEKNQKSILSKNKILILGLGFAYHVNAVIRLMEDAFKSNFEMSIVEPSLDVAQECLSRNLLNDPRVTVYSKKNSSDLYFIDEFVHFLLQGPTVLTHPASFNLHEKYFKELLSYNSSKKIKDFIFKIKNEKVQKCLEKFLNEFEIDDLAKEELAWNANASEDFLLMAYVEMCKTLKKRS